MVKERQATCIEVLMFLIWYSLIMVSHILLRSATYGRSAGGAPARSGRLTYRCQVMVLGQYQDGGYEIAYGLRGKQSSG